VPTCQLHGGNKEGAIGQGDALRQGRLSSGMDARTDRNGNITQNN